MFVTRLRSLLSERRISINDFAEMCDLPLETVKNVYYGKTTDPKLSTAVKMAEALNLSVNCLIGKCSHTPSERVLLENYRSCGKHGKAIIELIARYEAGAIKSDRERKDMHKIPCIIPHGDIHNGIIYDLCDTIEIETTISNAYIGIQMTNNDLSPAFCRNDILLFENRFPTNTETAAFFKADRIYIRKFIEEDGKYKLKCLHKYDNDIIIKRMDEVEYLGTIIGVVRE